MLELTTENVHLSCKAKNKQEVLNMIAKSFIDVGKVKAGFLEALNKREQTVSTYLGNGVSLPHISLEYRDLVISDAVQIFQFPEGVIWDYVNIVFIAIGVASKDQGHIVILKDLATVLKDEVVAEALSVISDKEEFIKTFNSKI